MADFEQTASGILVPANFAAKPTTRNPRPEMQEIATTADGRDITRGYTDPLTIQPAQDSVLQVRGGGDYRVYQEVLRDDQVASCFNQRCLAVIGKEWAVDPGGKTQKDKAAAEHLQEMLHHIGWDRVTKKMLYGVYYGFAVSEALWARDGRHIMLNEVKVRDRRRFGYDGLGRLRMKTFSAPLGELLPERKFWDFATGSDHDDEPYGLGLGHWLYWPAWFKRNGLKYWLIFLEKFGQPTAKGTYAPNALPEEKNKLLQALSAISTDAGVIVPEGMAIELLEAARSGTADYVSLYDRMDAAIAKVCVGQTASSQGTPGRLGNDELQSDVRLDLVKADADLVCESFNRSIARWLTEWNYPGAQVPRVCRKVEPPEDLNQAAERDKKIVDMGFRPSLKHIQDNYGGDWREVAPAQPPAQPTSLEPAAEFAEDELPQTPPDALAIQLEQRLRPITQDWGNQLARLLDEATSLEDLQERLVALAPELSLDDYARTMATGLEAAQLAGRNDVQDEIAALENP
ncbi:DUF935 domain-containing protein [Microbulbifer sp. OS29]|uniref:DUF935 domain-containing protein n=1 Tax=Microbulbifer okhotskensis TaxID=2926617 RepID=A0A9X2ETW2_9GAMM|nr:DUF935 family protein [Microbulbifer okhotskensis]MCO1335478.1 DUF935 domain-containing protein [Microbulbifer okhotskensis]